MCGLARHFPPLACRIPAGIEPSGNLHLFLAKYHEDDFAMAYGLVAPDLAYDLKTFPDLEETEANDR